MITRCNNLPKWMSSNRRNIFASRMFGNAFHNWTLGSVTSATETNFTLLFKEYADHCSLSPAQQGHDSLTLLRPCCFAPFDPAAFPMRALYQYVRQANPIFCKLEWFLMSKANWTLGSGLTQLVMSVNYRWNWMHNSMHFNGRKSLAGWLTALRGGPLIFH